jgi:CBS domain-containing protein
MSASPTPATSATRSVKPWTVLYTRGSGVRRLAELLAAGTARPVRGDLPAAIAHTRADLLVARHPVTTDLVRQVVPRHLDVTRPRAVVGAVGTGPHGGAVAAITGRLACVLDVPGWLVAASPDAAHDRSAARALHRSGSEAPHLDRDLHRVTDVTDLVRRMPVDALLVIGAPGGSWLQRQFFGPGHRLAVNAPSGAVVVRDAPPRCFQHLDDWNAFGPAMTVADALRLLTTAAGPVVEQGRVVGIVRRSSLERALRTEAIGTVMEPPVFVSWDAPVSHAARAARRLDGAPVPVVGPEGRLIGEVRTAGHDRDVV